MSATDYLNSLAAEITGVAVDKDRLNGQAQQAPDANPPRVEFAGMSEATFINLLGRAAIDVWGSIPRDLQETMFEIAVRDHPELRTPLAQHLHDRHPKTAHPPRPTALA